MITATAYNNKVQLQLRRRDVKGINLQLTLEEAHALAVTLPSAIENAENWKPEEPANAQRR